MLTHVDLKHLQLRKVEGRNHNELTIVSALFDRNGNYVTGNQKLVEMRLKDDTLERRADAGFTVQEQFRCEAGHLPGPAGGEGCRRANDVGGQWRREIP